MLSRLLALVLLGTLAPVIALSTPVEALAAPDECVVLGSDDLRYDAPRLTATITEDDGACFDLPDGPGTVYQAGPYLIDFVDDAGEQACVIDTEDLTCELAGEPPFQLRVPPLTYDGTVETSLQIYRLTGETGCTDLPFSVFGAARERALTLPAGESLCFDVAPSPTRVPYLSRTQLSGTVVTRLVDRAGRTVCRHDAGCRLPEGGSLIARFHPFGGGEAGVFAKYSLWDRATSRGCATVPADLRWSGRPLASTMRAATELQCWPTTVVEGERLYGGTDTDFRNLFGVLVDADGRVACYLGPCRVTGRPPFRLLVQHNLYAGNGNDPPFDQTPDPVRQYRYAVRSLEARGGCARLTEVRWGAPVSGRAASNGCRMYTARPEALYDVTAVDVASNRVVEIQADFPTDLSGSCVGDGSDPSCDTSGPRFVIANAIGGDIAFGLHDRRSAEGCRPVDRTRPQVITSVLTPGERECLLIDLSPDQGTGVGTMFDRDGVELELVDGSGRRDLCFDPSACARSGSPPFRLLVGLGVAQPATIVVPGEAERRSCLPLGSARGARGTVDLAPDSRLACLRFQSSGSRLDVLHIRRVAGRGGVGTLPLGTDCTDGVFSLRYAPLTRRRCFLFGDAPYTYDLLLVGDGSQQRVLVSRGASYTDETPVPGVSQPKATTRPRVTGRAQVGRTVRVAPGRWSPAAADFTYQWVVNGKAVSGATQRRFEVREQHAGSRLSVRVVATAPNLFPGAATSSAVRVGRRG